MSLQMEVLSLTFRKESTAEPSLLCIFAVFNFLFVLNYMNFVETLLIKKYLWFVHFRLRSFTKFRYLQIYKGIRLSKYTLQGVKYIIKSNLCFPYNTQTNTCYLHSYYLYTTFSVIFQCHKMICVQIWMQCANYIDRILTY